MYLFGIEGSCLVKAGDLLSSEDEVERSEGVR